MNFFSDLARPIVSRPGDAADDPPPKRVLPEPIILPHVANPWGLTPMLCEVLRRTVAGESAKEIAAALGRSHRTVECHHGRIVDRMSARNLLHAALMWDRQMRANATLLANLALAGKHPVSLTPAEPDLQPV